MISRRDRGKFGPTPHTASLAALAARRHREPSPEYLAMIAELCAPPPKERAAKAEPPPVVITPIHGRESRNPLRPHTLDEMVGQSKLKPLLRRLVDGAKATGRPMNHMLFVGASGTGKTTISTVIANEIGTRIFAPKAPVDAATLEALRTTARDGDVIFVDEIHMQVSGDRRGITQACDPESFYLLLEDGVLATPTGPKPFPAVTWIGATTDVGLLPEPLSNRFPIKPRLAPYSAADMEQIAAMNARALGLSCDAGVPAMFAAASRGVPREVNSYMTAAAALGDGLDISTELAREVIEDLSSTTLDGLTESMQIVLRFLYRNCRRVVKDEVVYSASVNLLATAAGHGRDTRAISLFVEPYLIHRGLLEVRPSGRTLSPAGVERAQQLLADI